MIVKNQDGERRVLARGDELKSIRRLGSFYAFFNDLTRRASYAAPNCGAHTPFRSRLVASLSRLHLRNYTRKISRRVIISFRVYFIFFLEYFFFTFSLLSMKSKIKKFVTLEEKRFNICI